MHLEKQRWCGLISGIEEPTTKPSAEILHQKIINRSLKCFRSDSKLASYQRETDLIKAFASGHIFILLTYYNYNSTCQDLRYNMFIIFNSLDMK